MAYVRDTARTYKPKKIATAKTAATKNYSEVATPRTQAKSYKAVATPIKRTAATVTKTSKTTGKSTTYPITLANTTKNDWNRTTTATKLKQARKRKSTLR